MLGQCHQAWRSENPDSLTHPPTVGHKYSWIHGLDLIRLLLDINYIVKFRQFRLDHLDSKFGFPDLDLISQIHSSNRTTVTFGRLDLPTCCRAEAAAHCSKAAALAPGGLEAAAGATSGATLAAAAGRSIRDRAGRS